MQLYKNKKEHEYWGNRARIFDASTAYVVGKETQRKTRTWLSEQLKDADEVLQLGCGTGQFSEVIAEKARHLTATDGALQMLDMARGRLAPFRNTTVQMETAIAHPSRTAFLMLFSWGMLPTLWPVR